MRNQEQSNKDDHQYLPEMTALFIEGLSREPEEKRICDVWQNIPVSGRILRQKIVPEPLAAGEIAASTPFVNETFLSIDDSESSDTKMVPNDTLRALMCGISNCFNDIFMAIWGNISLIHMNTNTSKSVRKRIRKVEQLIHHGSVLIHIVFGYLSESSAVVKDIRLNQLLQQINKTGISNDGIRDSKPIKSDVRWVSSLKNPACLARSISRIVEKLLHWIEKELRLVLAQTAADDAIQVRLMKIDAIIKRGFALTVQLKQYAGDTPMVKRRMRMKSLIKHTLSQFELSRHGIRLKTDLSTPLPDILADRSQLFNVLKQLIFNAIDAMPKGGRLNIATSLLSKESSQERLLTPHGIDYIVISVSDSGEGMDSHVQSRIFDPFYVNGRRPNRLGLGLSVAGGIVKAHGGYIQVSSHQGKGSTFRIYLPCPSRNRCAGNVSRSGFYRSDLAHIHAVSHATQENASLPIS